MLTVCGRRAILVNQLRVGVRWSANTRNRSSSLSKKDFPSWSSSLCLVNTLSLPHNKSLLTSTGFSHRMWPSIFISIWRGTQPTYLRAQLPLCSNQTRPERPPLPAPPHLPDSVSRKPHGSQLPQGTVVTPRPQWPCGVRPSAPAALGPGVGCHTSIWWPCASIRLPPSLGGVWTPRVKNEGAGEEERSNKILSLKSTLISVSFFHVQRMKIPLWPFLTVQHLVFVVVTSSQKQLPHREKRVLGRNTPRAGVGFAGKPHASMNQRPNCRGVFGVTGKCTDVSYVEKTDANPVDEFLDCFVMPSWAFLVFHISLLLDNSHLCVFLMFHPKFLIVGWCPLRSL